VDTPKSLIFSIFESEPVCGVFSRHLGIRKILRSGKIFQLGSWKIGYSMPHSFTTSYVSESLTVFRQYKRMAESAMAQVTDEQLTTILDPEMNSIACIVKHIAGNMRSRWTDFLTTDGEKPDRNRDIEFVEPPATREQLMAVWEDGWAKLFSALEPLTENDLSRTVMIRGEPHSVMQAINRQIAHYASHVGQIVFLAKHLQHQNWKTLSIPRGKSADFNQRVLAGHASQR
jgi:hypothetical protein